MPAPHRRCLGALVALVATFALGACAFAPPKPWEKGTLAQPSMQFDADKLEAKYQEHIYWSREGASGGYGIGGGGCGCN
jgi:hypothetical protein